MADSDTDTVAASHDDMTRPGESNRQHAADGDDNGTAPGHDDSHDSEKDKDDAREKAGEETRKKRRPLVVTIGVVIVVLLIAGGAYYWFTTRNLESTDDAYTDGRAITIASQVAGTVVSLDVTDNQFVKKGQVLIHIDPRQYIDDRNQAEGALATAKAQYEGQQLGAEIARKNFPAQLEQAQAQLANANANLAKAQADHDRQLALSKQATSQQDIDAATAALKQAKAQVMLAEAQVTQNSPVPQRIGETDAQVGQLKGQVEQAQGKLDQANLNLSWTQVKAPQDGWITKRNVEAGNYIVCGPADLLDRGARGLGHRQLQGEPARRHAQGPAGHHRGRRLSVAQAAWSRRQHPARLRLQIHRISAGERHRQFRQGGAARAGQDRDRQRARSQHSVAARDLGGADGDGAMSAAETSAPRRRQEWKPANTIPG